MDASGRGFAGTFEEVSWDEIDMDIGIWSSETEGKHTSNWKEFGNLVDRVKT